MHVWGDDWFKKHGDELYNAINEIESGLRKHNIFVCGKEKYGTYRDEYLRFWDGGFRMLVQMRSFKIKNERVYEFVRRVEHFLDMVDQHIIPGKKCEIGDIACRRWYGITDLNRKIGLVKLVNKRQFKMYNKVFQTVCKKYPNVVEELIVCIDGYENIKPCKWGNISGKEIHNKHWTPLREN